MQRKTLLVVLGLALAGCGPTVEPEALASRADGLEEQGCTDAPLQPILSVADFNGDGIVDKKDQALVIEWMQRGEYVAFFDRNADKRLNGRDVAATVRDRGRRSTALDREVAAVFWATERYRDLEVAIAEGFIPIVQEVYGQGVHWFNPYTNPLDLHFEPTRPEGLMYTPEGELLAVFYAHGPHLTESEPPPEGFTGDDSWHEHLGLCFRGLDLEDPTYDPSQLDFEQCIPMSECPASTIWLPRVHLLHLWLYRLNPHGLFGAVHPCVSPDAVHVPHEPPCSLSDVLR